MAAAVFQIILRKISYRPLQVSIDGTDGHSVGTIDSQDVDEIVSDLSSGDEELDGLDRQTKSRGSTLRKTESKKKTRNWNLSAVFSGAGFWGAFVVLVLAWLAISFVKAGGWAKSESFSGSP